MRTFVQSSDVLRVINTASTFNVRPSEILGLTDFVAFCFDEACMYIKLQIEEGKKPLFMIEKEKEENLIEFLKDL